MCGHIYGSSAKLHRRIQSIEIMRLGVSHKGERFHDGQANLGTNQRKAACFESDLCVSSATNISTLLIMNFFVAKFHQNCVNVKS